MSQDSNVLTGLVGIGSKQWLDDITAVLFVENNPTITSNLPIPAEFDESQSWL
jgi:hypothetical protein